MPRSLRRDFMLSQIGPLPSRPDRDAGDGAGSRGLRQQAVDESETSTVLHGFAPAALPSAGTCFVSILNPVGISSINGCRPRANPTPTPITTVAWCRM